MRNIAFIDTEIDPEKLRILDIGSVKDNGATFHSGSIADFVVFLNDVEFICGHNIVHHDLQFLQDVLINKKVNLQNIVDTLFLSPLLFPARPYHALVKDDKLQSESLNNPLNDSIQTRDLFHDEVAAFHSLDDALKEIYYLLLHDKKGFRGFFTWLSWQSASSNVENLIREKFQAQICENAPLPKIIEDNPVELAYCLALIHCGDRYSVTPPWVLKKHPDVERIMLLLRSAPCVTGCGYCNQALDISKGLKRYFGFDHYRTYAGEPLQAKAVQAAVDNSSILAVFPTGGGKSITFQVPALMAGEAVRGLTVVISPLQSLMKDQVDNLERAGITDAVTINGLLDPIERAKSFERVEDGSASILYISPESLRSRTIERLLSGRKLVRFVIDEAHCFSSWGQDFRVDYLYIGDFIKNLQEKKNLSDPIPISCFTATAKQKVIEDIREYFREKLTLELEIFRSNAARTNLQYKVFEKGNEEEKYNAARNLVEEKNCPTIIYVSRTRKAYLLANRLTEDGLNARPYHGKMDMKEKSENQDAFISGEVQVMVATSAFGMGVDKKDVGMVIHYEISDSLENYIQEAGRAGRDESITADCYVLFNEEDLNKHFILLNQTKLGMKEIQQVWKAIKELTRMRSSVSNSALEIARKAGWDDSVADIETRVTTAIAALENAGYLKRGQNEPRIFASSILTKTAQEAIDKINSSHRFEAKQKEKAVRIIKKLFSSKSKKHSNEEAAESRVDYISDHLGIVKEEVIRIISLLREEKVLADTKDLTAFLKNGGNINRSLAIVNAFCQVENFLLPLLEEKEKVFHLKELNERAEEAGCNEISPQKIRTIINFWAIKQWIKRTNDNYSNHHIRIACVQPKETLQDKQEKRHTLAKFIVGYLYEKTRDEAESGKNETLVEFSVHELKEAFERQILLFEVKVTLQDIEDALFYLSRIDAIKLEGGFLVVYNKFTVNRLEDNKKRYKNEDYQRLAQFYENKIQQIHIVGEYAKKMISDYKGALQFVDDYFRLNYTSFLNKYFPGSRQNEIKRNLTPAKFKQLFGVLSPRQLDIIKDNHNKYIAVAAGPGSGKTRILVHKLASLLLMEDVKHEQLLMATFSRAAAGEFKKRLVALIGNAANYVEIKTFHSYCFDLLGKVGSLEKSDEIIRQAVENIKKGEVEACRVTKTVLVIDEAQDMDEEEFALINALMEQNEDMRVIAVGDDDQNIYEFRGSSARYLEQFIREKHAVRYELVENYRSRANLVDFTNHFARGIRHRLKETPVVAVNPGNGKIKIIHYQSANLVAPAVTDILHTDLAGSACILTKTNEEALQVAGLLVKNNMPAKLIQSNEGFNLYNMAETRFFLEQVNVSKDVYTINDDLWNAAKKALVKKFEKSSKLEICLNMIREFELTYSKKKYKSDLEVFIRESKLEDFTSGTSETIMVSTMHKAKGREFDHVFLILENLVVDTDEAKRLLYVAMTRAKQNLTIHVNGSYLNRIHAPELERVENHEKFPPPDRLAIQLTHRDVWLDYFASRQYYISQLSSGQPLQLMDGEITNDKGQAVLKLSGQFKEKIMDQLQSKGYFLKEAKVNFILYWQKKDTEREIKIVLPELGFERQAVGGEWEKGDDVME